MSQTIHMTDQSKSDLKTRRDVQLVYFHEYAHLLQAVTTRVGIAAFRMVAHRYHNLLDALHFRPDLASPYRRWSAAASVLPPVRSFLESERAFQSAYSLLMGGWRLDEATNRRELELAYLSVPHPEARRRLLHAARSLNGAWHWIPLLPMALCEAHAESVAQVLAGTRSSLWATFGKEPEIETLYYTTVPALAYHPFPSHLQDPSLVAVLVDHALMYPQPDRAFCRALKWLASRKDDGSSWRALREALFHQFDEAEALDRCDAALNEATTIYRGADNDMMAMFVWRLGLSRAAIEARAKDPAVFLPEGNRTTEMQRLHQLVPVPRVEFSDTLSAIGEVSELVQAHQQILSGAAHLLKIVAADPEDGSPHGQRELDAACPFRGGVCQHDKTLECAQAPWARGPIGGDGHFCHYGQVGGLLAFDLANDPARLRKLVHEIAFRRWRERGSPLWEHARDWDEARHELGVPEDVWV